MKEGYRSDDEMFAHVRYSVMFGRDCHFFYKSRNHLGSSANFCSSRHCSVKRFIWLKVTTCILGARAIGCR